MRQIDQEIIQATDELKKDVALTTDIVTGNENTVVEVAPGNTVRSPKKMIEDCYRETQQAIEQQFGSLDKAVDDATSAANRADSASQSSSGSAGDSAASSAAAKNSADTATEQAAAAAASASAARESEQAALQFSEQTSADAGATADHEASAATWGERAEQQAKAAAQSSTTASSQATMAKAWAANPEDALVDGEQYSSLHYASKSSEYADASSGNAELSREQSMLAQHAMRNASNSEINANLSKVQAQQAATEAGKSKEASGVSEQKAADSAAAAKNSETAAVGASDSALDSKNSAAGSAGTATQQADRSESEADRSEAAANRAINASSRIVGELARFSFDTPPPGFFALDGSTIPNGKNDFAALANSGSRFITIIGNDLILADALDFGRGKGSSGRVVGGFESDAIRNITGTLTGYDTSGGEFKPFGYFSGAFALRNTTTPGRIISASHIWPGGAGISIAASRVVPTASENRPKSLTELVCIYHGVL